MAHGPSNTDHDGRVVGFVHGDDGWRGGRGDEGPRRGEDCRIKLQQSIRIVILQDGDIPLAQHTVNASFARGSRADQSVAGCHRHEDRVREGMPSWKVLMVRVAWLTPGGNTTWLVLATKSYMTGTPCTAGTAIIQVKVTVSKVPPCPVTVNERFPGSDMLVGRFDANPKMPLALLPFSSV